MLQDRKEKRHWKSVNVPCSLYDALSGLTKDEVDYIRYRFKGMSALKKADLATELARSIPEKCGEFNKVI